MTKIASSRAHRARQMERHGTEDAGLDNLGHGQSDALFARLDTERGREMPLPKSMKFSGSFKKLQHIFGRLGTGRMAQPRKPKAISCQAGCDRELVGFDRHSSISRFRCSRGRAGAPTRKEHASG
jgi:hypothetical protein